MVIRTKCPDAGRRSGRRCARNPAGSRAPRRARTQTIVHIDGGEGRARQRQPAQVLIPEETMHARGCWRRGDPGSWPATTAAGRSASRLGSCSARNAPPTAIPCRQRSLRNRCPRRGPKRRSVSQVDLSVVGFDNTALAHNGYVDLTTVDYARELIGATARELLSERIADQRSAPRGWWLSPLPSSRAPPRGFPMCDSTKPEAPPTSLRPIRRERRTPGCGRCLSLLPRLDSNQQPWIRRVNALPVELRGTGVAAGKP